MWGLNVRKPYTCGCGRVCVSVFVKSVSESGYKHIKY